MSSHVKRPLGFTNSLSIISSPLPKSTQEPPADHSATEVVVATEMRQILAQSSGNGPPQREAADVEANRCAAIFV
jgi:hypothetical protein